MIDIFFYFIFTIIFLNKFLDIWNNIFLVIEDYVIYRIYWWFNLSNLQGYITSKYKGWTSDKILKVAQGLYEKKLITYPRTASSVLEGSLVDKARKVLETHKQGLSYEGE